MLKYTNILQQKVIVLIRKVSQLHTHQITRTDIFCDDVWGENGHDEECVSWVYIQNKWIGFLTFRQLYSKRVNLSNFIRTFLPDIQIWWIKFYKDFFTRYPNLMNQILEGLFHYLRKFTHHSLKTTKCTFEGWCANLGRHFLPYHNITKRSIVISLNKQPIKWISIFNKYEGHNRRGVFWSCPLRSQRVLVWPGSKKETPRRRGDR